MERVGFQVLCALLWTDRPVFKTRLTIGNRLKRKGPKRGLLLYGKRENINSTMFSLPNRFWFLWADDWLLSLSSRFKENEYFVSLFRFCLVTLKFYIQSSKTRRKTRRAKVDSIRRMVGTATTFSLKFGLTEIVNYSAETLTQLRAISIT